MEKTLLETSKKDVCNLCNLYMLEHLSCYKYATHTPTYRSDCVFESHAFGKSTHPTNAMDWHPHHKSCDSPIHPTKWPAHIMLSRFLFSRLSSPAHPLLRESFHWTHQGDSVRTLLAFNRNTPVPVPLIYALQIA